MEYSLILTIALKKIYISSSIKVKFIESTYGVALQM